MPSATSVAPGATVTATIANGPGNAGDWVALFATGARRRPYVEWKYLNGTQSAPAAGLSGAPLTFTMPATPGTYNCGSFWTARIRCSRRASTITVAGAEHHAERHECGAGRAGDGDDRERAGQCRRLGGAVCDRRRGGGLWGGSI